MSSVINPAAGAALATAKTAAKAGTAGDSKVAHAAAPHGGTAKAEPANSAPHQPIPERMSTLASYRDLTSGRFVFQIMDQDDGQLMVRYPSSYVLESYSRPAPANGPDSEVDANA